MLELAGEASNDHKSESITPRHISLAVQGDEELIILCSGDTLLYPDIIQSAQIISGGRVIPWIHRDLAKFCRMGDKAPSGLVCGNYSWDIEDDDGMYEKAGARAMAADEALDAWLGARAADTAVVDPRDGKHYAMMVPKGSEVPTLTHLLGVDICCSLSAEQCQVVAQKLMRWGVRHRHSLKWRPLAANLHSLEYFESVEHSRKACTCKSDPDVPSWNHSKTPSRKNRHYQRNCENLLEHHFAIAACHNLCIETAAGFDSDMKWTPEALQALLFGLERRMIADMELALRNFALPDNKRQFVNANDVKLPLILMSGSERPTLQGSGALR